MRDILKGSTDQSVVIRIIDSTTGLPEEAVEYNTAGISLWYRREGATITAITPAALAALDSAHSDGGIEHIDDGYYRLDIPDAAFATGASGVMIGGTLTGMIVIGTYLQLVNYNVADAVRLGLTALPNAAADAAGGLPISDAGGLDLDSKLANTNEVTAARMGALTDLIDGGRLDLLIDAIKTCTDRLTAARAVALDDLIDGGRLDLLIDAIKACTDLITAARMGALTDLIDGGRLDLLIDAIKASTDLVTAARMGALTDWIDGGRLDLILDIIAADTTTDIPATLTTIAGYIDTEITTLGTELAKVPKSDGVVSLNATVLAAIADAVWDEVLTAATHNIATSAGRRLRALGAMSISDGTAAGGTINSITLNGGASTTDNIYNENIIAIVAGTGVGQSRLIAEYKGDTKVAIVNRPWDTIPDITSEYQIIAFNGILLTGHGLATGGDATHITLTAISIAISDVYNGSMIVITSGTGIGQARLITDYDGDTLIATVSPAWTTNPDATSIYKIIPVGRAIVENVAVAALAQINAEVVDTLNVDTYAEPGQEEPPATASLVKKLGYLYKMWRNKKTQTATTKSLFNDDGITVGQKSTFSDDATTFTDGEMGTGA